jgi:DNA-binding transcriptional regulator YbjK
LSTVPANPTRRAALADAGIAVLAREGGRGLTHRAVDAEAGAPTGTTSNYFRSRDELLAELGRRSYERLAPSDEAMAEMAAAPPSPERFTELVQDILTRVFAQRELYVALLELRLEATRRPVLRESLTATVRRFLEIDVAFHRAAGLPGDRDEIVLLHLAIGGLLLDQLTLPDALGVDARDVAARMVERLGVP